MKNALVGLHNKFNSCMYISVMVNLSAYTLSSSGELLLTHGLGFCPNPGFPGAEIFSGILRNSKERFNYIYSSRIPAMKPVTKGMPSDTHPPCNINHL